MTSSGQGATGEVVRPTARLSELAGELAGRWRLTLGPELHGDRLASVRLCSRADGTEAVLKLVGPRDRPDDEAVCLRLWGGGPSPRLLEADVALGALLLERIVPGARARGSSADDAAALLRRLQVSPPPQLPRLEDVVRDRVERAASEGRTTTQRVDWALAALERLGCGAPEPVLVHGDFDDRDLLVCERRGLAAIDPLPCAGDGAYDAASWIHASRRPGRRARFDAMAAATGLDRARLRDWCGIVAVHG